MKPTKIKRSDNDNLIIGWSDGSEFEVSFKLLRDECPCVNCKGESVMFSTYIPIKAPFRPPGFYEIDTIEKVGNYAIKIKWKDGHSTGIYSWDTLRAICDKTVKGNKEAGGD
ncbi:MAG: hypothetical protein UZ04_CHB001001172 [Chlorobi bacterium OLB4]|jgi:Uncharacterized protein conserved in bacteria|nr:MAG: hypothetical protein UZ04_CHB001001172 [Chlorobi bacterium OLB4]MBW7855062.1 DUF971 domain-containing protein [Ignavibacteria bacterium]OQY76751.1 MAG: hypothetical protein B6D43_08975 [Ignavibacteriales bacterium UTCHB1]